MLTTLWCVLRLVTCLDAEVVSELGSLLRTTDYYRLIRLFVQLSKVTLVCLGCSVCVLPLLLSQ